MMGFEISDFDSNTADLNPFSDANYQEIQNSDLPVLQGDGNSPGVQTDTDPIPQRSVVQLLGSVGSIARDAGTAAGQIRRDLSGARGNFNRAYNATASGNPLATWWQYASTTDKLVVGLAAVTLVIMVVELKK